MNRKDFSQLIKDKYSTLSPGQKKIAEYLVDHQEEAILKTAFQLGKTVGVSETTVIRFAYALGFNGFSDMQNSIRQKWLMTKQHAHQTIPMENERKEKSVYTEVIRKERHILQQMLHQLNKENMDQTIEEIIKSDRVYIEDLELLLQQHIGFITHSAS